MLISPVIRGATEQEVIQKATEHAKQHGIRQMTPELMEKVKANISEQDRAMLDYVVKLTKDATKCSPEDHGRLRSVGFDDQGILQITLIACWFNYINRVADALGVGRTDVGRSSGNDET